MTLLPVKLRRVDFTVLCSCCMSDDLAAGRW